MKATKLVLTGIAIAISVILILGTLHHTSQSKRRTGSVHLRDTNRVSPTSTGFMRDPLSMVVKLSN